MFGRVIVSLLSAALLSFSSPAQARSLSCLLSALIHGIRVKSSDWMMPAGFNSNRAAIDFMKVFGEEHHDLAREILRVIPANAPDPEEDFPDVANLTNRGWPVRVVKNAAFPNPYVMVQTASIFGTDPISTGLYDTHDYPRYVPIKSPVFGHDVWAVRVVGPVQRMEGDRYLVLFASEVQAEVYCKQVALVLTSPRILLRAFFTGSTAPANLRRQPSPMASSAAR